MDNLDYEVLQAEGGCPIKMWTKGVRVDDNAKEQLINLSKASFIHSHIAVMPDVHWGLGATVGSVIATRGAVIPAAVGVDIGCGMVAVKTNATADDLPDNLEPLEAAIKKAVPHGRTNNGGKGDRGAWSELPVKHLSAWGEVLAARYEMIVQKNPGARSYNNSNHLGTLGTGNHFIEICLDESNNVWALLHSGSRGAGNKIGVYFIEQAKREMERYGVLDALPDKDQAYLVEHSEVYNDYIEAVHWAQDFAMLNRKMMLQSVIAQLFFFLKKPLLTTSMAVNCHHNYVTPERHYDANVLVTRKGAVRAGYGELGIIPGSMGASTFIVSGKGNLESFCSCSHGAGRVMSRGEAKRLISLEQHIEDMKGIQCDLTSAVLDESPRAYKPVGDVMKAQSSLVDVVHTLRQVVNVKGV